MGINVRLHRRKIYLKMTMQIVLLNVYETRQISHNIFSENPLPKPVCASKTFKVKRNNFTSSNSFMSNAKSKVVNRRAVRQ